MALGQLLGPLLALAAERAAGDGAPPWLAVGMAPTTFVVAAGCVAVAPAAVVMLRRGPVAQAQAADVGIESSSLWSVVGVSVDTSSTALDRHQSIQ